MEKNSLQLKCMLMTNNYLQTILNLYAVWKMSL